jgi:hypothetical protein
MRKLLSLLFLWLVCCAPPVFDPAIEGGADGPFVELQPAAPLDAAPAVMRIYIRGRPDGVQPAAPEKAFLFEGEIRSAHLGQLERDEVSAALEERMVATLSWLTADGDTVLAPTHPLEPGGIYTIASGEPRFSQPLLVTEERSAMLRLVWPPEGTSLGGRLAVYCGADRLPPLSHAIALSPTEERAQLIGGAVAEVGQSCARIEPRDPPGPQRVVPPPAVVAENSSFALEPTSLGIAPGSDGVEACTCDRHERALGPGCAEVLDDRLLLRTPAAPRLWAITAAAAGFSEEWVLASEPEEPLLIAPLPAASALSLTVFTVDQSGQGRRDDHAIDTLPRMAHVVITEVQANSIGEEPAQEWVELYNDGAVSASLEGYVFADVGGESILPAASLPPGGFALLVNEDYDPSGEYDPPPAPGAVLVRLAQLGKNGLSNEGEPLKLVAPDGRVTSRFPASPKPKAGHSVYRIEPSAPDDWPASFSRSEAPTPGAPNPRPEEG